MAAGLFNLFLYWRVIREERQAAEMMEELIDEALRKYNKENSDEE